MATSYFNINKLRRQRKQSETAPETVTATAVASPPAVAVNSPAEEPAASPLLDDEDQKFLERLAALSQEPEGTPPPLPVRPSEGTMKQEEKKDKEPQEAAASNIALPMSPPEVTVEDADQQKEKNGTKKGVLGYFSLAQAKFKQVTEKDKSKDKDAKEKDTKEKDTKEKDTNEKNKEKLSDKDRNQMADSLLAAAAVAKTKEQEEAEKETKDLTAVLDDLNLSAVNNRVFSFTKESEELFAKFTLVLKDIINGVPTAYDDLQKLFTEYDTQLKKMYGGLPPFLQNMVKSLPTKITAALGPEILAAQAEKPGFDAKAKAAGSAGKSRFGKPKIPSLKSLITAEGAVATMLRSILNFLKLRFPAVLTGTNVVMSLAVCLLLFVFWYCHKRGRETRLEKERLAAEEGEATLASSASSLTDNDSVFGDNKAKGESSKKNNTQTEKLKASKDIELETQKATVADMPSVNLPDPVTGKGKGKA